METVSLSTIVQAFNPEWLPFFADSDLEQLVVLRDGWDCLEADGAVEIITSYICLHQKETALQ